MFNDCHAYKLPRKGNNYKYYSFFSYYILGRCYIHSGIHKTILDSYSIREKENPKYVFRIMDCSKRKGGRPFPHKTHQNGLSVDFMVPVVTNKGESEHLPTHMFNKFGYTIEFDKKGQYKEYRIDYQAMAAHIVSLHKKAKERGVKIWRVIFDPKLKAYLFRTKYGKYLKTHINLSKKKSWVRHDEHYHVDFICMWIK